MPTPLPADSADRPIDEREAGRLRRELADALADGGFLDDPAWRRAVEAVPRHRFVRGYYTETGLNGDGLTVWEPVTPVTDLARWLRDSYTDRTLITQFDGDEPDWERPAPRAGGVPTSSSTLPSLVLRMWLDADVRDGHNILEVGTGTGYSTALACARLGEDGDVASVEVDGKRLEQAAEALYACGYHPDLAVADGLYGYWPSAPYDRIVAACSVRGIPPTWIAQTKPGGKVLATLSGWLYGYARVLLTVHDDGTAEGPLLPGTISFMTARAQERPAAGNPVHWESLIRDAPERPARHDPRRLDEPTAEGFFGRFLAQLAAPTAQTMSSGDTVHLVDVTSGSVAALAFHDSVWRVRQSGPARLWDAIEAAWDAWNDAGRPGPETFRMRIASGRQIIDHPSGVLSFTLP